MQDYQVMPDLTAEEYAELKADIAERGVMVPIELDQDGNVLDGHHRLRACRELGLTDYPTVIRAGMTEEEKIEHALIMNAARRSLTEEQKKEIAQKIIAEHPTFSFQRIAKILGIGKTTAFRWSGVPDETPDQHEGIDGKSYPASAEQAQAQREVIREEIVEHPEKSDRQIARETGASHVTVAKQREAVNKIVSVFNPSKRDADALKDPDIQRRLAENEGMNVAGAIREQKRDQLVERLDSVEAREAKAIEGVYDVIVIDPPWPLQKIERDARPNQAGLDYPTMSIDEIKQLRVPAADDCHVFLWTTQKFLHEAFHVMEAWNVKTVWTFVWIKNNGVKPYGLPTSTIEFVLYGHIGAPQFINEKDFRSHITADATGHSRKPEAFYDMVRNHTAGRRLDMFNRRSIEGFDAWGKEAPIG